MRLYPHEAPSDSTRLARSPATPPLTKSIFLRCYCLSVSSPISHFLVSAINCDHGYLLHPTQAIRRDDIPAESVTIGIATRGIIDAGIARRRAARSHGLDRSVAIALTPFGRRRPFLAGALTRFHLSHFRAKSPAILCLLKAWGFPDPLSGTLNDQADSTGQNNERL
jgi:hypothetical protein